MKPIFAIIASLFLSSFCFSQELKSAKSLASAFSLSAENGKPVFLVINSGNIPNLQKLPDNAKVNFKSALDDKEVIAKIEQNFVVFKTTMMDTSIRSIMRSGNINRFPAYIFLRSNREIFYNEFANSTDKKRYFSMIDNALAAFKQKSISELEKDVQNDKGNNSLLTKLIDARKKIGITNNADLIEQYASNLKISDFNNYQNVLYILEAGPYVDGTAYKLAYTNRKLIDSIYKTEPQYRRVALNNAIISNTMIAAAKGKNLNKAMAGANFARSTWSRDYRGAEKSYNNQMLWYYNTVKDTASYLRTASYFYDNHYMNLGADSIKKIEERNRQSSSKNSFNDIAAKKIVSKEKMDSLMKLPGAKITQSIVTVSSPASSYANELNNAAWKFYEIGTKNINYLTKAMLWSRRSIELNPIAGYYDTLAHILYRIGYFEEAIKMQETAIEKAKSEKISTKTFESELKKIKSRLL
ncbi:hypothetical protein [Pedobacter agri]|uniref:hypothetical protein n=1 Tax=Pedobacter agri TaxID=454586 RepID=UPI00292EFC08|nr:hypothetical protein [Pedobacter agri]